MEYSVLIFLHIVSGTLWASIAFFFGAFLSPSLAEAGPGAGAIMGGLVKRKMPQFLTLLAIVSILTGLRLYMLNWGGVEWLTTPKGLVLTLGGLAALHAFFKGLLVSRPLALRLGQLAAQAAQGQPDPAVLAELQAGQAKMGKAARSSAFELLAVLLLMAFSRVAGML